MAATLLNVAQAAVVSTGNTGTATATLPASAGFQENDYVVAVYGTGSGVPSVTSQSNWLTLGGAAPLVSNGVLMSVFGHVMTAAEAAAANSNGFLVTVSNTTSTGRNGLSVACIRGTTGPAQVGKSAETVSQATHTAPTVTDAGNAMGSLEFFAVRTSVEPTALAHSTHALRAAGCAFATGSGGLGLGQADLLTAVAAGGTVGGGVWTETPGPNTAVALLTLGFVPAASAQLSVNLTFKVNGTTQTAAWLAANRLSQGDVLEVTFTPVSGTGNGNSIAYTINWGDGTSSTVTVAQATPGVLTHTYNIYGFFTTAAGLANSWTAVQS